INVYFNTEYTEGTEKKNRQKATGNNIKNRARSSDGGFFVGAEGGTHGVTDFAEGGVGFDGGVDRGHEIVFALSGFAKGRQGAVYFILGTLGAEFFEACGLAAGYSVVDLQ